ncbi:MAG: epoxyqueuosine reductase [Candidatus Thorarchaeota archaeon]
MTLSSDLKKFVKEVGFIDCGITNPESVNHLYYDWIGKIRKMSRPVEEFPITKSIIIMIQEVWDNSFNLSIYPSEWKGYGMHPKGEKFESYYIGYEIMRRKAQNVVDYLQEKGYRSKITYAIPLKTTAVASGLGAQGKNTLFIHPLKGPRVMIVGILTEAELDIDKSYDDDMCGDCQKCVDACPTGALEPYRLTHQRCMTYSAESPCSIDVPEEVREKAKTYIKRPTSNSFIDCSICVNICPLGKRN